VPAVDNLAIEATLNKVFNHEFRFITTRARDQTMLVIEARGKIAARGRTPLAFAEESAGFDQLLRESIHGPDVCDKTQSYTQSKGERRPDSMSAPAVSLSTDALVLH
jgi:hypothetical protein